MNIKLIEKRFGWPLFQFSFKRKFNFDDIKDVVIYLGIRKIEWPENIE